MLNSIFRMEFSASGYDHKFSENTYSFWVFVDAFPFDFIKIRSVVSVLLPKY